MNDANARVTRYTHSRRHAEIAIQTALLVCEVGNASEAQVADLADAVDALSAGQFHAAALLAEAAIEGRSKVQTAIRPATMARSLAEVRAMLAEIEKAGAARHSQDF